MKYVYLSIILIAITGCSQAPKTVITSNGMEALQIRCGGSTNTWNTCYAKAKEICSSGFSVIDQEQFMLDLDLPIRILTFRCK